LRHAIKDGQIQEVDEQEIDVELRSPSRLWSTHTNSIPMPSSVQVPRIFYGGRFFNQAVPLANPEAALVQNLDEESGQSFDRLLGEKLGAIRARARSRVLEVDQDHIRVQDLETGEERDMPLYNRMPFNRFTALTQTPLVEVGQEVEPDQVLARSNFTDDRGELAMTVNARIGLVPYKGWSMDDAVVISQGMADKLTSVQTYLEEQEWDGNMKGGKRHFTSLFPTAFKKEVLENLDDEGVAKVGTTLQPGDPYILATRPRMFSSQVGSMGRMTRAMQQTRSDGSRIWDGDQPGEVVDVARTKNGVKVMIETRTPAQVGDKIVLRAGAKGVISKILSDEQVPRTVDGEPLELLLNPLSLPSRSNSQTIYEMLLGKIAKKRGEPLAVPAFTKPGEAWHDLVQRMLDEEGIPDKEEVFDPTEQRKLENPITVGYAPVLKLQHMASKKISARGQGSYDAEAQPLKGGSESAQCFAPKQQVQTLHGAMRIGSICDKRKRVQVLSWDETTDQWVYRPVTDWFVRKAHISELVTVKYSAVCNSDEERTQNHACMRVTKGHVVYTPEGPKQVADLNPGDEILTPGPVMTDDQWDFLVGTMLGDGYAHPNMRHIRIEHTAWQYKYLDWKQSILSGLGAVTYTGHTHVLDGKTHKSGSVCVYQHDVWDKTRKAFYNAEGVKTITQGIIGQINEKSLAVWFLDDGYCAYSPSRNKFCVNLATCGFQESEVVPLCARVNEILGTQMRVVKTHKGKYFMIQSEKRADAEAFARLTARYIPLDNIPKSKTLVRKFAEEYQREQDPYQWDTCNRLGRVPVVIKSITPYTHDKPGVEFINVYDITIDKTHNYVASGISVSNSKRLSNLEISALMSSGAYANLREASTVRGTRNDEFWKAIRSGHTPPTPGSPFVWDKFQALLQGSGYLARDLGQGKMRLGPFTDQRLKELRPMTLKSGESVNPATLEPVAGGLFDPVLVGGGRWGQIELQEPVPNPAFEKQIAQLLGIRQADVRRVVAGEVELDEVRK
jgi:hypothetical protein